MRCPKHPFDRAHDICTHCGGAWCSSCLVYPLGPGKDAFCVQCALARSVRARQLATKPMGRRQLKARRRELASWLESCPDTPERLVNMAPIPEVRPEDIIQPRGSNAARIDWCA